MGDSSPWYNIDDDVDEVIVDRSPSVLFHNSPLSITEIPEGSPISPHKKSLNSDRARSIKEKKSRKSISRSNSSDCAYSDGDEAFRMNIAECKSPREGECLNGEEKVNKDSPFLKL